MYTSDNYGNFNAVPMAGDNGTMTSLFRIIGTPPPPPPVSRNVFTPYNAFSGQAPAGVPAYQPMNQGSQLGFSPTSSMFGGQPMPASYGAGSMQGTPNNHWINAANQRSRQVNSNYGALTASPMPGLLGG